MTDVTKTMTGRAPRRRRRYLPRTAGGVIGCALLVAITLACVLGSRIYGADPIQQDIANSAIPPAGFGGSWAHPLGTDQLGRDVLARILAAGQVSLMIGVMSVTASAVIGVSAGLLAGYYGRWVDTVIMRLADIQLGLPPILLAITIAAGLGPSLRTVFIVLILSGWIQFARLVRSQTRVVRLEGYVTAAQATGVSDFTIMRRHILTNVSGTVIVVGSFQLAHMILLEAGLSFLGLGIQPPTPTWGGMLSDGVDYLTTSWWLATFSGAVLVLVIIGVNLLGDWLRDALNPTLR